MSKISERDRAILTTSDVSMHLTRIYNTNLDIVTYRSYYSCSFIIQTKLTKYIYAEYRYNRDDESYNVEDNNLNDRI